MYSEDGKAGYPGTLNVAAKLSLSPVSGELKIEYSGMSTRKTPVDISNNILINLAGHETGMILITIFYGHSFIEGPYINSSILNKHFIKSTK